MVTLAQKVLEPLDWFEEDEIILDDFDVSEFDDINTYLTEYDRRTIQNIRQQAGLVLDLIQHHDQVIHTDDPPRTKHEINGGYKIAKKRGARLHEVDVFNLYFKFHSHLRGDGIALMYRPNNSPKERIILLPDDTDTRFKYERSLYSRIARELVFSSMMDPDDQSILIENMRLLNIHERCAQSLMHEYGHVLHWREFYFLELNDDHLAIFDWFVDEGYYELIDVRVPNFDSKSVWDKLMIMKESLVEDYRISLNMDAENGKFILPNKFCHFGDFQIPELLLEGVSTMKKMLRNQIAGGNNASGYRSVSSTELDSLDIIKGISSEGLRTKWVAGRQSVTKQTLMRDRAELQQLREVAVTKELKLI